MEWVARIAGTRLKICERFSFGITIVLFARKSRAAAGPEIIRIDLVGGPPWRKIVRPILCREKTDAVVPIAKVLIIAKWHVSWCIEESWRVGDVAVDELIGAVL